ncbi:ABC transporter permease subunit [Liberibacter crescens]|uniref:ABC transporter permease subunit n=1 Tax=Liberibacter crescens TaxID=1273132 RepID=UPI0007637ECA|nr:branched-chain amino acid ABC transporter permease [Liberibacter crescens]
MDRSKRLFFCGLFTFLKETLITGALSLGLFFLFVGIQIFEGANHEMLWKFRFNTLIVFLAVLLLGKIVLQVLLLWLKDKKHSFKFLMQFNPKRFSKKISLSVLFSLTAVYPLVVVYFFGLHGSLKYVDNLGVQGFLYIMLAWGLSVVVGLTGLLNIGYVAFYAIGAYTYAILGMKFNFSPWSLVFFSAIVSGFFGVLIGLSTIRLRGDYLAIITLAIAEIVRIIAVNWVSLTNGNSGIFGIKKLTFFGIKFNASQDGFSRVFNIPFSPIYYKIFLFYVFFFFVLLAAWLIVRLRSLPIGRAWEAVREDEIACRSLGINVTFIKLGSFFVSSVLGGVSGAFFAARQGFISPESFGFLESVIILTIVVFGGMTSLLGITVAAFAIIGGTEILRNMSFMTFIFGQNFTPELYRMLLFGLALILVMVLNPHGLSRFRQPSILLDKKKLLNNN